MTFGKKSLILLGVKKLYKKNLQEDILMDTQNVEIKKRKEKVFFFKITEKKIIKWEKRKNIEKLINALYYKNNSNVRHKAMLALEKIGNEDVLIHLIEQLSDSSPDILDTAKRILIKFSLSSVPPPN